MLVTSLQIIRVPVTPHLCTFVHVSITPHLCSSVRVYYPTPLFFSLCLLPHTSFLLSVCLLPHTSFLLSVCLLHHTTPLSFCPYVCYPTPPLSCFRRTLLDRECRNKYPPLNPFSNEGMKKNSKERWTLFFLNFFSLFLFLFLS